jgi:uncharacterized repeat protein (TIGR01451 family)/CSLREA domain-containing protein
VKRGFAAGLGPRLLGAFLAVVLHAPRRILRFLAAACLLLCAISVAQAGWVDQSPGGPDIYASVFFVDTNTGWAVGDNGTILKTTDGGGLWSPQTSGTSKDLNSVFFVDANTGWTVGENGEIRNTMDGTTWNSQDIGGGKDLNSVFFVDANTGWTVGEVGIIVETTNGGTDWNSQNSGTSTTLESVCFADGNTGWTVGENGTILKTVNGGTTWSPQTSGTSALLDSVDCLDANTAWVAGSGGTLLKTTNGGTSWSPKSTGTGATLAGVEFIDANSGWTVGTGGLILRSRDGGETWFAESSGSTSTLNDVFFVSATHGWTVGDATILATTTGGDTIDLSLTKVVDNPTPPVGFNVLFTLVVSNAAGWSDALGVQVTDLLPTGYTHVSDDGSGAYNPATGVWTVATLASGDSATLKITASVLLAGDHTNVAEVTAANQPDTDSTPGDGGGDDYATAVTAPVVPVNLIVNSTLDTVDAVPGDFVCLTAGGVCTLRAAIQESNASVGFPNNITFNIPMADPGYNGFAWLITPGSGLPPITDPVVLDATTQPGYAGTPLIDVDGTGAGATPGIQVSAGSSGIHGLALHDFSRQGMLIDTNGGNSIQSNYIGTDYTGIAPNKGNGRAGLEINSVPDNTIGGTSPVDRNVIVDSARDGVVITGASALRNVVQGNYIGLDATGTGNLGNFLDGVVITSGASDNLVGGGVAGAGNRIAFSGQGGVVVNQGGTGNTLERSEVFSNDGLGIDLQSAVGPDSNDNQDTDSGTNNLQNYPVLTKAFSAGGGTTLSGTLNSEPNSTFKIDFYANTVIDPSTFGEGERYLGSTSVNTDVNGDASFLANVPSASVVGEFITATATHPDKSTSEFSANIPVTAPEIDLSLTKTVDNPNPDVGSNVVFTVSVSNHPNVTDATGVQVTDLLPTGYTHVGNDGGGSYVPGTGVWTVGNVAAGSNATLHITAQVLASGDRNNVAEVTAADQTDVDSTPGDGTGDDYAEQSVTPLADLAVTKDDGLTGVTAGTSLTYTITVTNLGPSDVTGAAVDDTFDPSFFDVPGVVWACAITTAGSGTDACGDTGPTNGDINTTVDLSVGAVATFTVTAPVLVAASGTISNTATAAVPAGMVDPDATNNSGTDNDTVVTFEISGTVYHDANANSALDAGELGIGNVWVKLVSGGSVIQVLQADPDTGAYTMPGVADGSYTVIVDDNSNPADATPTEPVNWLFQNPATGSLSVTVAGADVTDRDFGFTFDFDLGADCACGYEDGLLTQRTITIDGDMSDWGPVFSDGDNNACDAVDDTDLDHPVQSTGRNLLRTAVTFDGTSFSMWTQRVGQSSNTQNFVYYADTSGDGIMQAGEPVVVAKWQGATGAVVLELYTYDDLGSGGDSMLDGSGFADGYSLPGDLVLVKTLTLPDGAGQGSTTGASDGTQMEWTIEWTELGVAPGSAIGWHVGSTNSNPAASGLGAQIDDNIGGCGGQCTGSNQFAGVQGSPGAGAPGQTIYVPHSFTNTGNGPDLFDFAWSSTGDFVPPSVVFYRDLGTVGQYDPGVDTLIVDTDGDSDPDTGNLAAGASFDMLVAIELPGPPALGSATVTTTATSNFVPGCGSTIIPESGSVDDVVTIPEADLAITKDDGVTQARPGFDLTYTITVTNNGSDDADDAQVTDTFDPAVFDVPNVSWTCAITTSGSGTDACNDPGPTNGDLNTTVDLSNGAVATFTVTAPILVTAAGTISNTSTVAGNLSDPTPGNNDATDNDTVLLPLLAIVKRAFQLDGTPIASGSTLPTGMPVRFMLYIDNAGEAVADVSLQDVLDVLFQYQPGSMKVDNTLASSAVCPGGVCDEAAIFTQADGSGTAVGDGDAVVAPTDTDVASYTPATTTIDLGDGNNNNNATLNIAADSVWAVVFTIRMQ